MSSNMIRNSVILGVVGIFVFFILTSLIPSLFGYWLVNVDTTEIGIKTKYGKWVEVVGPDQYNAPFDFGADIQEVSVSGVPFSLEDASIPLVEGENIRGEVGATVSGTIFIPGLTDRIVVTSRVADDGQPVTITIPAMNEDLWRDNRHIYMNVDMLKSTVFELARQAMKTCISPLTIGGAAAGGRNDVALCIDEQLTSLAVNYGLEIRNVVVPEITPPESVRAVAQEMLLADQQAQKAVLDATRVWAEAERDAAAIAGQIAVTAAAQQEQLEQRATSAAIEVTAVQAERLAAQAQATFNAEEALYNQALAEVQLRTAQLHAQAASAQTEQLAILYQTYPQFAAVIVYEAYAKGLEAVEKVFYIPTGVESLSLIGGPGTGQPFALVDQNGQTVPVVPMNGVALPTPTVTN